jgi:trehalose 2-sulfotransferase
MRPRDALVICASPRTGSGLLCSALWSTGLCGRPDEYLGPATRREYEALWGCRDAREYAERVGSYGTTPNGVFGIKVHAHQRHFAVWLVDGDQGLPGLAERVHFCRVRRRDKVRQAVSAYVAGRTGRYALRRSDNAPHTDRVPFDYARIQAKLREALEADREWTEYFAAVGVQPIEVWYEDHLENGYAETTLKLIQSIGIEAPANLTVCTDRLKQADERAESLVRRFRDERGDSANSQRGAQ